MNMFLERERARRAATLQESGMIKCFRVLVESDRTASGRLQRDAYQAYLVLACNAKQAVRLVNSTLRNQVDEIDRMPVVRGVYVHFEVGQVAKHGEEKMLKYEKEALRETQEDDIINYLQGEDTINVTARPGTHPHAGVLMTETTYWNRK